MCLLTEKIFPKRAKEDIIVYKILDRISKNKFKTPFQATKVYLGMTLKAKNSILRTFKQSIIKMISGGGVHAYTTVTDCYWKGRKQVITVWIIPKGTLYWTGEYDTEIAARKMTFVGVLDTTKPLSVALKTVLSKTSLK